MGLWLAGGPADTQGDSVQSIEENVWRCRPILPTVIVTQVGEIYFDAPYEFCGKGRRAKTNIQPIDVKCRVSALVMKSPMTLETAALRNSLGELVRGCHFLVCCS